jgi:hypothetical protein
MQNGLQTDLECDLGRLRAAPSAQTRDNYVQCQLQECPILRTPRRRALPRRWRADRTGESQRCQTRRGRNERWVVRDDDACRERVCSRRANARTRKKVAFQLSEEYRIAASTGDTQTYAVASPMCDQRKLHHLHGGSLSLSDEGTIRRRPASTLFLIHSILVLALPWAVRALVTFASRS